jgi:gliding motility-associated-like protein
MTTLVAILQAQLCQGSLGDPIVNITFGAGNNPGAPLSAAAVGYQYFGADCPNDGYYTVRNTTNACFGNTWHTVSADHSGKANGYFVVINASNQPSDFYVDTIRNLCGATTYEFAGWILNLSKSTSCNGAPNKPNITFKIERPDGTVLQEYNTGNINPTNSPEWVQYGFFFTTPAGVPDIVIRMRNNAPGGCGNDLLLDDITFRPCGPRLSPSFDGISGTTREFCEGEVTTVLLNCDVSAGFSNPSFQWQESIGNTNTWSDISGATTTTLQKNLPANTTPGTYFYRLTVVETVNMSNASCKVASIPLAVTVRPRPQGQAVNSGPVCEGEKITLTGSGGVSYSWYGPDNYTASGSSPVLNNVVLRDSGFYYVEVLNGAGCRAVDSTRVRINARPTAGIAEDTIAICTAAGRTIDVTGGLSYTWSPSAGLTSVSGGSAFVEPPDTTRYTIIVSNISGCTDTAYLLVNVLRPAIASAGPDKVIIAGQSVRLDGEIAGSHYAFAWSPSVFIVDPQSLQPLVNPQADTKYVLTATSLYGCGSTRDTVQVTVFKEIKIPNAFTPNGDGVNDTWVIPGLAAYRNCSLSVFNRYGQRVFETKDYTRPWNGKGMPIGTYYYLIDLKERGLLLSGWVDILK